VTASSSSNYSGADSLVYQDGWILSSGNKITQVKRNTSGMRTTLVEVSGEGVDLKLERSGGGSFRILSGGTVTGYVRRDLKAEYEGGELLSEKR
jgi:hypothetical protein